MENLNEIIDKSRKLIKLLDDESDSVYKKRKVLIEKRAEMDSSTTSQVDMRKNMVECADLSHKEVRLGNASHALRLIIFHES